MQPHLRSLFPTARLVRYADLHAIENRLVDDAADAWGNARGTERHARMHDRDSVIPSPRSAHRLCLQNALSTI